MSEPVTTPEYTKPIAAAAGEIVMSTPSWYGSNHGAHATVFVDARQWPPSVAQMPMQVGAAARLPSGQWVVTEKREHDWRVCWYADIRSTTPLHAEPAPFTVERELDDEQKKIDDDGPFTQLVTFGDLVIGIPDGDQPHAFVLRDRTWHPEPRLPKREGYNRASTVKYIDGREVLDWNDKLYDASFVELDARGCTRLIRSGESVFALHGEQLVEMTETDLVPRLAGHTSSTPEPGPGNSLWITLSRDGERGTTFEYALYDTVADTVTKLSEDLVGRFPKLVTVTTNGALVLHDDSNHSLRVIEQLDELPRVAARDLPPPQPILLEPFDDIGASSRPTVWTSGDHIVMAVGNRLRFHSIDNPLGYVALVNDIVGVVASGKRIAALDSAGVLHLYDLGGALLLSKPAVDEPRSLAVDHDGKWIAVGRSGLAIIDDTRTQKIAVEAPIAVTSDLDGGLVIACEQHRLVHWTNGELRDLPPTVEQIIAVRALGNGRFACAGQRDLYLLDLAHPELTSLERRLRRPHIATHPETGRIAYCDSPGAVEIERFDGTKLEQALLGGVRYSSYSAPTDMEVTVHGLSFLDSGSLVIELDDGRGNIVDPDTASTLKLDEQPGDETGRWIFICGGKILIAG